jgi:hypothetical protein
MTAQTSTNINRPQITRRWGTRLGLAALGVTLVAATACGGSQAGASSGQSDESAIRDVVERQLEATRDKDWRALHATASGPGCSASEFEGKLDRSELALIETKPFGFEDFEVEVDGDAAYATYTMTYDGETMAGGEVPDQFIGPVEFERIDGEWFDGSPLCRSI